MKGLYTEKVTDINQINMFKEILKIINPMLSDQIYIERFYDNDKGYNRKYNVYKIVTHCQVYVLKKSDDIEISVYEKYLDNKNLPVPKFYGWAYINKTKWILMDHIDGPDLRIFNMDMASRCAYSLAHIFNMYWQEVSFEDDEQINRFERYWTRINKRSECLINYSKLSSAYGIFLDRQLSCPRTLCNGDFLQFNAIESEKGIIVIDWAFAGIMPYSIDIARLIAHGSDKYFPFPFYMTNEYRKIFVQAMYDKLLFKPDYKQFIWDIILACLNECIEFIESELNDISIERDDIFTYYYESAEALADVILNGKEHLKTDALFHIFNIG